MLKHRNVLVVSMLLGASTLLQERSPVVQGVRLAKKVKDDAEAEDEAPAKPSKDHPPKEVSHFTQDKVKAWKKRSWWRDNALPTTPSYNDVDEEATSHPNGSTFVQNENQQQWTDGNCAGSEKVDYWWHIDRHQGYTGESYKFDDKAAHPSGELSSWNKGDSEPKNHPMGSTAQVKANQPHNMAQWWTHGNGQGSEKWDHVEEAARFSDSDAEFHAKMKQGNFLPNMNHEDGEPTSHPMGITAQVNEPNSMAQWWTHGNGQGSEKWDHVEEAARFSDSDAEFHAKMKQGNFLPNMNHEDGEPTSHPMGITAQLNDPNVNNKKMFNLAQKEAMKGWWTQGNGQGSEKWDHVEEAARFSNSQEEFHAKMKQGNFVPAVNHEDGEPTSHPMGITAQVGSRAQVDSKAETGTQTKSQAKWWSTGNGRGSEKFDAFQEAARFSKDEDDFDHKVQLQGYFMPSDNGENEEPTWHPMGFSFVQNAPQSAELLQTRPETNHERFWMNIEAANSKDEKEFNEKAAKIKIPSGNEEDGPPPMPKANTHEIN